VFEDWFYTQRHCPISEAESVGWTVAAKAFFAEKLKTDERLRTIIFVDLLTRSVNSIELANAFLTDLTSQSGFLQERFGCLEDAIRTLGERKISIDQGSLSEALVSALTRVDYLDALRRLIGVEAPSDAWAASLAAVDVRARIAELSGSFFGRETELVALDEFVENNDRGLAIVAAPAGGGKSALLACWLDRRRARGDVVVRHFVSSRFKGTTDPVETLRHLTAQLRDIDASDPDDPRERIPANPLELLDKLHARLSRAPPRNERLIVILDGLDELRGPLNDNFIRATLADGTFVIVSGRAVLGETPLYLQQWQAADLGDVPIQRFDVAGLSASDVLVWLEEIVGHLRYEEMRSLAGGLRKTTDGLPLFLSFVIEDLMVQLPQADRVRIGWP
jgi:hypothetical protein